MGETELDEIIVNLKLLSTLDINKKIITTEKFLNVESGTILEGLQRLWRGDSRDETVKRIDNIITKAIQYSEDNSDMLAHIQNSEKGINNLKETYSKCPQTNARLDTIIEKIKTINNN